MTALKLAVIAGEPSGDILGANLVRQIAVQSGEKPELVGVGGEQLTAEGLTSLFDFTELSIIGFSEVLARLPRLVMRMRQTADAIIAARPDCLIIIDSPDFSHRVARKVRKALPGTRIINYVCPTVWAWKPERAAAMTAYVDHVLSIFPFEPEIVARLGGPPLTYVGHRLMEDPGLAAAFAAQMRPQAGKVCQRTSDLPAAARVTAKRGQAACAGVRRGGPGSHRDQSASQLCASGRYPCGAADPDEILGWDVNCRVVTGEAAKWQAFGEADVAMAASGTVLLELALAGVPHMSCYKLDPIARVLFNMITTWTGALPNMIADRVVIPEYYDKQVRPERLARQANQLATDTLHRAAVLSDFELIRSRMEVGVPASELAARTVLSVLAGD
jgi:lipid-A-disaccharide synthase